MKDPEPPQAQETPFLVELFLQLENAGIRYCVLRDADGLPQNAMGHDLDILVKPKEAKPAFKLICKAAETNGGRLVACYRRSAIVARFCGHNHLGWWGMAVDVFVDMEYGGLPYYNADTILDNSRKRNGVRVASEKDSAVSAFLKECLYAGCNRKGYAMRAAQCVVNTPERFKPVLQDYFGRTATSRLMNFFGEGAPETEIPRLARTLRRGLLWQRLTGFPLRTVCGRVLSYWQRFTRVLAPPGFTIALLGTDGSGKSTIIGKIEPPLMHATHDEVICEHLRPNLLPSLAKLFGRPEAAETTSNPHSGRPSGTFGSLARLSYYTLDYVLGFWIKVFPSLVRCPSIWIFDRYFHDLLTDPRRARLALPRWVIRLYSLVIPRPDIILCLGADAAVVQGRKAEISLNAAQKAMTLLRDFCRTEPRAVWIDTGVTIEESTDQALAAVTARMAARHPRY